MSTRTNVSKRWSALLATAAVVVGLAVAGCGGSSNAPSHPAAGYGAPAASSAPATAQPAATVSGVSSAGAFAWLNPQPAPPGWIPTTTAASQATLFYPPACTSIPGDRGTVTGALRDSSRRYAGYLNVTPRQGAEQLHGWSTFRMNSNREEGDAHVRKVGAAEGLRFRH